MTAPIQMDETINTSPELAFRRLYITAPLGQSRSIENLQIVGASCSELTIGVGYDEQSLAPAPAPRRSFRRRLSSIISTDDADQRATKSLWHAVRTALRPRSSVVTRDSDASMLEELMSESPAQRTPVVVEDATSAAETTSTAEVLRQRADQFVETNMSIDHWTAIFSCFPNINTLTFSIKGDTGWPGSTDVEFVLGILRPSLELAALPRLQRVRFQPIHAMGILLMRWHGFGALTRAPASGYRLWQSIACLDLQLHNPFSKISGSQNIFFLEVLHDYLSSFAPQLIRLRFIWLDGNGPCPLTLEQEPELRNTHSAIQWLQLQELWLGKTNGLDNTMRNIIPRYAPRVHRLKNMISRGEETPETFEDHKAWVEIVLPSNKRQSSSEEWFDVVDLNDYARYSRDTLPERQGSSSAFEWTSESNVWGFL